MRILLLPLSWLYGLGSWIRNLLFDKKVLPSYRTIVPTICVGNLCAGGTGKTPHVEYLVRVLTEAGLQVAVLSRGYKRKSVGFLMADEHSTVASIGDEMMQMSRKFPDVPMAVCENRLRGVKKLHKLYPDLNVVILDDAFQHRSLTCGYYLLLTAADNLYVHDYLLPYGRLRESKWNAIRANCVVVTKCPDGMKPIDERIVSNSLNLPTFQSLYFSHTEYRTPLPVFSGESSVDWSAAVPVVLLTGIAHAHYLSEYASSAYTVVDSMHFADHHAFTTRDMANLINVMKQHPGAVLLTTEKDAMRIRECADFPDTLRAKAFYQPIQVVMKNQQEFNQAIIRYVREANRHR